MTIPDKAWITVNAEHDCKPPYTGFCVDGQSWQCPECSAIYEHICGEAEGCYWKYISEEEYERPSSPTERQAGSLDKKG